MTTPQLSYRHTRATAKPHYVSRSDVARVASSLRHQLGYRDHHVKIDTQEIASRISRLAVNGIDMTVDWDLEGTVEDETGAAALGSCEYDLAVPGHALIYINMDEIEDRSYLGRSTVLHELGHAIFDAPAWVLANRQGRLDLGDDSRGGRAFRLVTPGPEHLGNSRTADGPMDWAEFRANEVHGRVPGAADGTAPGAPSPVPALRSAADRRSIPDRPGADQGRLHRPARLQARDGGLRARRGLRAVARLHRGAAQEVRPDPGGRACSAATNRERDRGARLPFLWDRDSTVHAK